VAVIASIDPQSPLARRLYDTLVSGGTVDDALDVLCSQGLRAVADFGVLEAREGGSRVVLRGRVVATGRDGVVANESGLWRDVVLADDVALSMGSASPAPRMPLASGIAMSGAITAWRDPAIVSPAATPVSVETALRVEAAVPVETPVTAADVTPSSTHVTSPASPDVAEPSVPVAVPGTAVWEAHETPLHHPNPTTTAEVAADEGEARPEIPEYDSLLALTMRAADVVPVPAEAPQPPVAPPVDNSELSSPVRDQGATLPAEAMESAPYDVALNQARTSATGGKKLLSAFPWEMGGTQEAAPAPAYTRPPVAAAATTVTPAVALDPAPRVAENSESEGDGVDELEERTIRRSALAGPAGPTVPSTRCVNGHLNPHFAAQCRVCRGAVPAQEPVLAPRPSLGILRATTGGTIPLERNVILGRNPHLPNGYVGEQPSLIKVSDATKGISTQHAEVRLDGWLVSVRDLGSTNGTEVILPGRPPITLRAHDPLTIEPGTRVILAGVVEYVFEATA
jgi:hypothetical protein